jgi:CheY-like chemotaxis protein
MKSILIVDDEQKIRSLYRRLLEDEGYHIFDAPDANEAANILLIEKVDLVLLDLNMPKIRGDEMLDIVKVYDVEFKVMVASVYPLDQQKRLVPHADGYFDKADGMELLLHKIKEILNCVPSAKR